MASDDPFQAFMGLGLADRRAVERLLSSSKRKALRLKIRQRLEAERRERRRARNPADLLGCSRALSKHLITVAAEAPGAPPATDKARSAIRDVVERFSALP